jgi:carboxypeptidase family protein
MPSPRWITTLCTAALLLPAAVAGTWAQAPVTPPPPAAPETQTPAASLSKPGKKKYSHANDFVIRGTVFNDKALSFPGVQLRIRRAGEKKFRWEDYTNSRGEFAIRVPQGSDYEMVVRAKGFMEQTRTINAKNGENEERMVFRMQPTTGEKK